MRHGIGLEAQRSVLLTAGVDRLWSPESILDVLDLKEIPAVAFRPSDVFVMVQPNLLTKADIRRLAKLTPMFEVLGHAPVDCSKPDGLDRFRGLAPMVDAVEKVNRGGNVKYRQPTPEEIAIIVGWWHGSMKPREFHPLICEMMGEPNLPKTWARDVVTKATGNSKRDPNAPGKRPLSTET